MPEVARSDFAVDGCQAQTPLNSPELFNFDRAHRNLTTPALYEAAIRRGEGLLAESGALVVNTAPYTGRSPRDKFIVDEPNSRAFVWWGKVNRPISPDSFDALLVRTVDYLRSREVFIQDCFVGADPRYRLSLRVITEYAWHSLFARTLFTPALELTVSAPDMIVLAAPSVRADPACDRTHSEVFILLDLSRKIALIGGTRYAGEIKKAVFTLMNYLLPFQDVLPMHCAASLGQSGDVALFFLC
ncbi:MAG: phosphoenolpyruvate carboxykinase (ATP) [Thermoflexales bacterium]|nr:phosphoenolpyruvate carboxykinase (ATP) [Thermoflexales bacterium]